MMLRISDEFVLPLISVSTGPYNCRNDSALSLLLLLSLKKKETLYPRRVAKNSLSISEDMEATRNTVTDCDQEKDCNEWNWFHCISFKKNGNCRPWIDFRGSMTASQKDIGYRLGWLCWLLLLVVVVKNLDDSSKKRSRLSCGKN